MLFCIFTHVFHSTCTCTCRFHGRGTLYFTNGGKFEADWERGKAVGPGAGGRYAFKDGLQYEENEWRYCDGVDRRFWTEVCQGIKPAGMCKETNNLEKETRMELQGMS